MKRLIALLGVFALLGTLFVLATSSPSSAQSGVTSGIDIKNTGIPGEDNAIIATGTSGCESQSVTVDPGKIQTLTMDVGCGSVTIRYADATGQCETRSARVPA